MLERLLTSSSHFFIASTEGGVKNWLPRQHVYPSYHPSKEEVLKTKTRCEWTQRARLKDWITLQRFLISRWTFVLRWGYSGEVILYPNNKKRLCVCLLMTSLPASLQELGVDWTAADSDTFDNSLGFISNLLTAHQQVQRRHWQCHNYFGWGHFVNI